MAMKVRKQEVFLGVIVLAGLLSIYHRMAMIATTDEHDDARLRSPDETDVRARGRWPRQ